MRRAKWLKALMVIGALAMQCGVAHAAPEVGWWWNPDESGRGFFVESQNGIIYLAGYFYASDGRATWLVSGGPNADPYSYSGRLLAFSGGQSMFGDYRPPAPPIDAGAISVQFSDDTHGMITWPGGTVSIERDRFGGAAVPAQPDPGWWWNPDESGRGYSIEVQGDTVFIVAFMYDESGNPVWYYSAGKMDSPTTYDGPWLQFANGQTLTGPYQPPTTPITVGQLSVEFTAIDEATLTFTDTVTSTVERDQPKAGKSRTVNVKRQFPAKPSYRPAQKYSGVFHFQSSLKLTLGDGSVSTTTIDATGTLIWENDLLAPLAPSTTQGYNLKAVAATATFTETMDITGNPPEYCEGVGTFNLVDGGSTLSVDGYAKYNLKILLSPSDPTATVILTCTHTHASLPIGRSLDVVLVQVGKAGAGGIYGIGIFPVSGGSITYDWNFAASSP